MKMLSLPLEVIVKLSAHALHNYKQCHVVVCEHVVVGKEIFVHCTELLR